MNAEERRVIEDVFRAVLDLDKSVLIESVSRETRENWDSMAQVALVSALDDEFDLVIEMQDAVKILSYSSCISIIDSYL